MDRIAIIGIQGSGKSTFANKLGKALNRKVTHLDKEYFLPGWKEKYSKEQWDNFQKDLIKNKEWIIDGNYKRTIDLRLEAADTIVYFDFPKLFCVLRVCKRSFTKQQPFDKPEGTKEKVSKELLKFIITYPKDIMRSKLEKYEKEKRVYIVKNDSEAKELLKKLSS